MSDPSSTPKRCSRCGAYLDLSLPDGVCAACLWGDLLRDEIEEKAQPQLIHIAGHEVLEEIGHGGMGVVYRARQEQPPRDVALKIVSPYSLRLGEARKRFLMEAEAMAAIEHSGVLPLYQAGEDEFGRPWLTMMLARGGSLIDHLPEYRDDYDKAVALMLLLCDAVAHAHERGLLHRDIKPANILFDEDRHPYVADFGLAKWADAEGSITQTSYLLGSPAYLAPETAELGSKACTTLSDVYGLGAVFYELITGKQPYEGNSPGEILTQIVTLDPPSPRLITHDLPRDLEVIVQKSMAREPSRRYQSARELAQDLERWRDGVPILARPLGPLARLWYWAKRNPSLALVSALLISIVLTSSALLWQANRKLGAALHDAEERVDFMVRRLPEKLEPLGRLDILDDVFADVQTHYARSSNSDPVALARRADFHTEWAQIFRPRGLTDQSLEQLRAAYTYAGQAYDQHQSAPSLVVSLSRINAGWRLAEVLIEANEMQEAERILMDVRDFLTKQKARFGSDFRLRHLEAAVELELLILYSKSNRTTEGLAMIEQVENLWAGLAKDFSAQETWRDQVQIEAARVPFYFSLLYYAAYDDAARAKDLDGYVANTEALLKKDADNPLFISENFFAQNSRALYYLENDPGELGSIAHELAVADERMQTLITQDPGNMRWVMQAIHLARVMVNIAEKQKDQGAFEAWFVKLNARLFPAYDRTFNTAEALAAVRLASDFCLTYEQQFDEASAIRHHLGMRKVQLKICQQFPNNKEFVNLFHQWQRYAKRVMKSGSQPFDEARAYAELLREKSENPALTQIEAQRWRVVEAVVWHTIAESNSVEARANASRAFLGSLDAATELLDYEEARVAESNLSDPKTKKDVDLRMSNRLHLIEGLLLSAEKADQRLVALLDRALASLDEDSRRILTPTIDRAIVDDQSILAPLKKYRISP